MIEMTEAYLKTVSDRVNECATVGQLRECLAMYKNVLYSTRIRVMFLERIEVVKEMQKDRFTEDACTRMEEELEDYSEILYKNLKDTGLNVTVVFKAEEGEFLHKGISALLFLAMEMAEGKKREASRLLGIDVKELTELLKSTTDRRLFLRELRKKLRTVDV